MTATEKKTDAILTSDLAAQINEHHRLAYRCATNPQGIHEALRQDLRISGLPLIIRWELLPVEYLFDGAAA